MPGKQMSIDSDLSNGLITEEIAKLRREEIRKEADFYGAMDGASKFVQGDVKVGILITAINVVAYSDITDEETSRATAFSSMMQQLSLSAGVALVPLMIDAGAPGKEILNPVAVTIFGGLISSTLLDTFLTPVLFLRYGRKPLERLVAAARTTADLPAAPAGAGMSEGTDHE